jgi:hypothetical protein
VVFLEDHAHGLAHRDVDEAEGKPGGPSSLSKRGRTGEREEGRGGEEREIGVGEWGVGEWGKWESKKSRRWDLLGVDAYFVTG